MAGARRLPLSAGGPVVGPGQVVASRVRLVGAPTPVHELPRLAQVFGVRSLWVKRDDLSATAYGGNKPRKLEYLLGDAVARGRRAVITFGGLGTNHGLATTVHGASLGLRTTLVLVPQPITPRVVHALCLDAAFGAELVLASGPLDAARRATALLLRAWRRGEPAVLVPPGGASARGTRGYVDAALELAAQVRAGECPEPGTVFVAVGTGGTAAGLALGFALGGLRCRTVGVVVTDVMTPSLERLRRLGRATARLIGAPVGRRPWPDDALMLAHGWLGDGYGAPTPEASEAVTLAERLEGIPLETTYTGKCLAALRRLACESAASGGPVLFWNTVSSIEPLPPDGLPDVAALPAPIRRLLGGRGPA